VSRLSREHHLSWTASQVFTAVAAALADVFACLGATMFMGYFLNYAQTELDL
jgi:hypothetical protein